MKGSEGDGYDSENCGACCRCYPIFALESDSAGEPRIREEGVRCDDFLGEEGEGCLSSVSLVQEGSLRLSKGRSALPNI